MAPVAVLSILVAACLCLVGSSVRAWATPAQTSLAARSDGPLSGARRPTTLLPKALAGRVARANGEQGASGQQDADLELKDRQAQKSSSKGRNSLDVRIDDVWYDLSGWRKAHPAGEHWIDYYDGRDATEVMHAFHSDKARKMFQRLPKSKNPEKLDAEAAPVSSVQRNFRDLRAKLEKEGWWQRDIAHEIRMLSVWAAVTVGGVVCANQAPWSYQLVGTVMLALANTQAGWLAHDYIHGIDKTSDRLRFLGPLVGGMSPLWWSDKHNKHHALTNEVGVDEDIATDPILYVRPPAPENDSKLRKFQQWTLPMPFSLLFVIWRFDSIKVLWNEFKKNKPRKGAKKEAFFLACHWCLVFAAMPKHIVVAHILLSGLITAIITTATHQSEEMFEEFNPDFVDNQFRTTRDAKTANPFSTWVWGGMQYQLEHHLFPSMPRSKYPALQPILSKFAQDNQIPGGLRITPEWELLKLNWNTYARVASEPAVPGTPSTRGRNHHVTAIPA